METTTKPMPEEDLSAVRDLTEAAQSAEDIETLKQWHDEARAAQAAAAAPKIGRNVLVQVSDETEQAIAVHSGYENGRRA